MARKLNNVKQEVVSNIVRGLQAEGYKDTPHNQRLYLWAYEHVCKLVRNEKGQVVEVQTSYGTVVGRYEW